MANASKNSKQPRQAIQAWALWGAARVWECIGGLEEKGRRREAGTDNKERAAGERLRRERWGMGDEGGGGGEEEEEEWEWSGIFCWGAKG